MEPINTGTDEISVGRAAKILGISRMTLYRWIDAGNVIVAEHGGIKFLSRNEVERLKTKKATGDQP